MNKLPTPLESAEQATFVQWLDLMGLKHTSIPNSTYTTSIKQKMHNKRQGLHAGLPDVLVVIPNKGLLFVELKRRKGGVVSEAQRDWILALNTVAGVEARVCAGSDAAIAFVGEFYHKAANEVFPPPTNENSMTEPDGTIVYF